VPISAFDADKKALRAWAKRQRAEFLSLDTAVLDEVSTRLSDAFLALIAERSWPCSVRYVPVFHNYRRWMRVHHAVFLFSVLSCDLKVCIVGMSSFCVSIIMFCDVYRFLLAKKKPSREHPILYNSVTVSM
jgi:hypothetical protein